MLIDEETIRNKIYIIRGQKVMLDADLGYSEIYKKAEKTLYVMFYFCNEFLIRNTYKRRRRKMEEIEQIYRKYTPQVYKFLFSLCHDKYLAEELTQETFFQAMKSIDKFRGDCRIYVWLCSIAKHLWYQELKKREREKTLKLSQREGESETEFESAVFEKAEVLEIYKILHTFEEPLREVMYLRLNGNFTFKEIGEIMGKDENWARVTFYRGKQRVRKESHHEM